MTRKDLNCKLSNSKDEPNTESGLAASPSDSPISSERHPEKTVTALVQHIRQLEKALEQKEVQIKNAHTQLAHADKLATLGTMGAGIAHELNNPLTVISAEADEILDAVREGYDDIDLTMLSARNIKNCAERMRHIIDHIRRYARKDDDEPWQRLDINLPIQDSLIILKPQIENSGIVVNLSLTQNLPKIWGHPSRLESVFQNLIANARDAFNHVQDGRAKHRRHDDKKGCNGVGHDVLEDDPGVQSPYGTRRQDIVHLTDRYGRRADNPHASWGDGHRNSQDDVP